MKLNHVDSGTAFDWGRTSEAYARYRPGYPEWFYDLMSLLGIGLPGQRILDLGTGTGVLARAFACRGAIVTAIDISNEQIAAAAALAKAEGLQIGFNVCPAEEIRFPDASFDIVSAGQSWLYFDRNTVIPKVLKVLTHDGLLVLTHLSWLPHKDPIAARTEELVLKYNPEWNSGGYRGNIPAVMEWSKEHFDLRTFHAVNVPLEFTREAWRGRIRACRGVGASLPTEKIEEFDAEHARVLEQTVPETFTVLHQITLHAYARKGVVVDVE
jgi:ubiquinone/menaquinone biosynthesis C-methylase UbiE